MDRLSSLVPKSPFSPAALLMSPPKSRTSDDLSHQTLSTDGSTRQGRYRDRPSQTPELSYLDAPRSIRLISLSRSPSPFARLRSAHQSEDEDEEETLADTRAGQVEPLVRRVSRNDPQYTKRLWQRGGLGHFLFNTPSGQRVYIGLLVFWLGGCEFGTLLLNRFIFWTGTYKFPYPLTMTLLQLLLTHTLLLGFANLTRIARSALCMLGLGAVVAPSGPYANGPQGFNQPPGRRTLWTKLANMLGLGRGGIAGGGLFEFRWMTAKHVLPLVLVFNAKLVLSNVSYAYAVLPVYQCARIGVIPFSLLFTYIFNKTPHNVQTLSSSLTAVLNLLLASIQPNLRAPWQGIVAGVFSAIFVALYPILLLSTYQTLLAKAASRDDLLADSDTDEESTSEPNTTATASTRAIYKTLHYSSLLSIVLLTPLVLLSGEMGQIRRNCYFLDVPWFWFLVCCASLGGFAVFTSMLPMVLATSPLTATFVAVPRSAFQLVVLSKFRLLPHSWVGVGLCLASCLWYLSARGKEGKRVHRVGFTRG